MSDLIERLRLRAQGRTTETAVLCIDAAHEIERLQAALDRARSTAHRGLREWVGVQSAQTLIRALENVIAELDGKGEA